MSKQADNNRAKIEDVAAAANVSIMSVSRAMRGVEGISQNKRKEILKIARELGYYPNKVAVSLAASSSNLIGVSVPTLFGAVFSEIYEGMRSKLDNAGFATVIDISDYSLEREAAWVERMISWQPAGIVLSGVDHSEETKEQLRNARIPVLEIWDYTQDPIDLCVGIDHIQSGIDMGEHLVKLGYKNPAYIGVERGRDIRADRRLLGLETSFWKAGHTFLTYDRASTKTTFDKGYDATARLLSNSETIPDVICYLHDNMAFGGLMFCEQNDIKCPEEIGIVGYNGLGINNVLKKRITTSVTPRFKIGEEGAALLIAKIMGARTTPTLSLPVIIEEGQTTRQLA